MVSAQDTDVSHTTLGRKIALQAQLITKSRMHSHQGQRSRRQPDFRWEKDVNTCKSSIFSILKIKLKNYQQILRLALMKKLKHLERKVCTTRCSHVDIDMD